MNELVILCVVGGMLIGIVLGLVFGFNMAYEHFDKIITKTFENIKKERERERI